MCYGLLAYPVTSNTTYYGNLDITGVVKKSDLVDNLRLGFFASTTLPGSGGEEILMYMFNNSKQVSTNQLKETVDYFNPSAMALVVTDTICTFSIESTSSRIIWQWEVDRSDIPENSDRVVMFGQYIS